jgi:glucose/arabinose dehydrogenase
MAHGKTVFCLALLVTACSVQELAPVPEPTSTTAGRATTTTAPSTTSTSSTVTTTTLPPLQGLAYQEVAALDFPIQITALPGSELSYVATKDGRIWVYDGSQVSPDPVLDISEAVRDEGERGLLSLVLHPDDPGRLFIHYSANDGDTVVAEYTFIDPTAVDPGSERILLRLDQPAPNHNGGMLQYGSDGFLYLRLGDGGGSNDQFNNGQNPDTLLGGLVAISVDGEPAPSLYSMGLRNPWRFWIDEGLIYIADVGQNAYEEVSVTTLAPGLNFGWPITEGLHCFRPASGCDTTGQVIPVVEVSHGHAGTCSITGGVVYRGAAIPEIDGHFFYSDLCGGYLRSFRFDGGVVDATDWTDQVGVPGNVVGFGVDGAGEMYVATTTALLKVVAVRG